MDPPNPSPAFDQTVNKGILSYKLFEKLRLAWIEKDKIIGKNVGERTSNVDLDKKFFNEMEHVLDQDPYGRHTKIKFTSISKSDEVYLRFSEVIQFYMWSPLDEITQPAIKSEVRGMKKMSNFAKVKDVRKFITNNFGSIIHEWAKIEKINPKLIEYNQIDYICNLCLERNGLPVIPDETNDSLSYLDLKMILEKAQNFLNQLDEFEQLDSGNNIEYVSKVRVLLERFHKMYLRFLSNIPSYQKLFQDVYEGKIESRFYPLGEESFTDFLGKENIHLGTIWRLLFNSQDIIRTNSQYKGFVTIYPKLEFGLIAGIWNILNKSHHSDKFNKDVIPFKENAEGFIESLKDLMLIPSTVVFYRKEEDAFGIHYKGNTLDGKVFVMLSQEGINYDLGKFYFVTSLTNPAYLTGYAALVPGME